jgi:hypothetical protein
MAGFEITCPECRGRGKMEYVAPRPMPRMSAMNAAIDGTETVQKLTKNCETCGGTGRTNSKEPVPVIQHGRRIGWLSPSFDPNNFKSTNWLYDARPGDFVREGNHWIAARTLGPGDLEAVPGFVWDRE